MTPIEHIKYIVENKSGKKSDLTKHLSTQDIRCLELVGYIGTGYSANFEETWKVTKRAQEIYDVIYKPLSPIEVISNFIATYIFRLKA